MATDLMPSSLDLQRVDQPQRAFAWKSAARTMFPGLTVHRLSDDPMIGSMDGQEFGPGQLWNILSPPLLVDYAPVPESSGRAASFSVMLQLQGTTIVRQRRNEAQLAPQDLCLLDGVTPFHLEVTGAASRVMFMRMPRDLVICRYPFLAQRTAQRFDSDEPGVGVLRSVLTGLLDSASLLAHEQCTTAVLAAACLMGMPKLPDGMESKQLWRVRSALSYIDAHLSDPELTASVIAQAQGISRRSLDEIMLFNVGTSLNAHIWLRRLSQAATDLQDVNQSSRPVTSIAFSVGFVDAAHFTRAFRRKFGCTPTEWRSRN